jgi:predicted transcriptional regulator
VREVQEAIRPARPLAYTTVLTIMDRLYHKGFLRRTLQSRTHLYEPAVEYAEVRDKAVETLISSFFGSKEKLKEFLEDDAGNDAFVSRAQGPAFDESLL